MSRHGRVLRIAPPGRGIVCSVLALFAGIGGRAEPAGSEAAVRMHRMGTLVVRTSPGARVSVEQTGHEFWFGAALANQAFDGTLSADETERYRDVFRANFNAAVTENALKWLQMERQRGRVNHATVDAMLRWADQHRVPLRGHNIYWGIPRFIPPWVQTLPDDELRKALEKRGRDVAARYRGRFAEYDLNNEMIHGNYYAERLGPGITRDMSRWILEEDPEAKLFLNDYDILTGRRHDDYVAQIQSLLEIGVPIAGIGVQGHSHRETFDRAALLRALDALARFKLPIRVTEFNLPGQNSRAYRQRVTTLTAEEESAKAREIVDFYRLCFGHPAVTGILMWGFWEGANWIPASSLFRRDWSPTPAAKAYRDLVFGEWWTRWTGTADAHGHCEVAAFFGTHRIIAEGKSVDAILRKVDGRMTVEVR